MASVIQSYDQNSAIPRQMSVPQEASIEIAPRAIPGSKRIVCQVPQTTNNVGPVQQFQIQLPQRGMLRSHSAYLHMRFKPNTTSAWSFAGSAQSAAVLFRNITVQAGSQVIETALNYGLFHNNIALAHAMPSPSALNIESVCSGVVPNNEYEASNYVMNTGAFQSLANANAQFPASTTVEYDFTIPLYLGSLNPKNSPLIPLQFISGGLLLTFQVDSIANSIYAVTAADFANFEISDLYITYDEITPSGEYLAEIARGLSSGRKLSMETVMYQNILVADNAALRQLFNINCSSLEAILWFAVNGQNTAGTSKFASAPATYTPLLDRDNRYEVYVNNELVFNGPEQLNQPALVLRELIKALSNTVADHTISGAYQGVGLPASATSANSNGTFTTQFYVKGLSTKVWADDSCSFPGSPCSTVTIQFNNQQGSASNTYYIYLMHTAVLSIDASGSVSKFV